MDTPLIFSLQENLQHPASAPSGYVASLAVGGPFRDEAAGIHGGTVDLAGQSSVEAPQAPRQEKTPWQLMQS